MELKEMFELSEDGKLSYEDFKFLAKEAKCKFVDLSEGNYVAKNKYEDDLSAKEDEINLLNATITERENDLVNVQNKLKDAGQDTTKLQELTNQLGELQTKYDNDMKSYQDQLAKQNYEFAVKDFAGTKTFSSNAAKRDFINTMLAKGLQMDGDKILGADDFAKEYSEANEDAFFIEKKEEEGNNNPLPSFVGNTNPSGKEIGDSNAFVNAMKFTPINGTTK